MATMRLLLDYDGVILRSTAARKFQNERSAAFMHHVTGMSMESCVKLNSAYYRHYGHTTNLINAMFRQSVTLREYNDFVFDDAAMAKLELEPSVAPQLEKLQEFERQASQYGVAWSIFTNAPSKWVTATGGSGHIVSAEHDITMLKPAPEAYARIEKLFENVTVFVFIDDDEKNILAADRRGNWKTILFDGSKELFSDS